MKRRTFCTAMGAGTLGGALRQHSFGQPTARTRNVIFVMTDGLRWQEVFEGADAALMNKENGAVSNVEALRKEFWRDSSQARREALLPFTWSAIAKQGQLFGNRKAGSEAWVTNGKNFSYPGYSEAFCGFPDDRINSNDKVPNPNVSMLEWLHAKPAFRGKVAAFGAWDTFPFILNSARAGFLVNAGFEPLTGLSPAADLMNTLKTETKIWEGEAFDSFIFRTAIEYLRIRKPRVLFLLLGETDEWAHAGKYSDYLQSAHRVDSYLKELWETTQSMPAYRGNTSLIFATDHGRGEAPVDWKSHGERLPDSKHVWMGFLGPDTKPLGERSRIAPVTQSQIAATIAALLGEDYAGAVLKAGKPISDVLR